MFNGNGFIRLICDMELQEYILSALENKTVIFVTHQVEFLPAADLILVWLFRFFFSAHSCIYDVIWNFSLVFTQQSFDFDSNVGFLNLSFYS